jgi:hypothetical protein
MRAANQFRPKEEAICGTASRRVLHPNSDRGVQYARTHSRFFTSFSTWSPGCGSQPRKFWCLGLLELPERARVAKELLVREGVLGVVWRIPPEGYYRVADDIVREFLTQSNENPDTLDREPTFKRLCGSWVFRSWRSSPA